MGTEQFKKKQSCGIICEQKINIRDKEKFDIKIYYHLNYR